MTALGLCLALGAALLAGCSGSSSGSGSSGGSGGSGGPDTPVSGSGTAMTAGTAGTGAQASPRSSVALRAALLTAADLPAGMAVVPTSPPATPFPCTPDAPTLDDQVPPSGKAQVTFADRDRGLTVVEEITDYGTPALADRALTTGERGMDCPSGAVDGRTVRLTGPDDLAAQVDVPAQRIERWTVTTAGARETIVVARLSTRLVALTFGASTAAAAIADPAVVRRALSKVLAAG